MTAIRKRALAIGADRILGAVNYQNAVLGSGPYLYYTLDETSGLPQDSSGNGLHAASNTLIVNQAPLIAIGRAVSVTGSSTYADRSGSFMNGFTAASWEAVINPSGAGNYRIFMSKDNQASARSWQFRVNNSNKLEFILWTTIGGPYTTTGTTTIAAGTTYHVAATYDGAAVRLYVNGTLDVTSSSITGALGAITQNLEIGRAGGSFPYTGLLDEPAIYNRSLSGADIATHYACMLNP